MTINVKELLLVGGGLCALLGVVLHQLRFEHLLGGGRLLEVFIHHPGDGLLELITVCGAKVWQLLEQDVAVGDGLLRFVNLRLERVLQRRRLVEGQAEPVHVNPVVVLLRREDLRRGVGQNVLTILHELVACLLAKTELGQLDRLKVVSNMQVLRHDLAMSDAEGVGVLERAQSLIHHLEQCRLSEGLVVVLHPVDEGTQVATFVELGDEDWWVSILL